MDIINQYINEIDKAFQRGNATEHTYRPYLKQLIEELHSDVIATNEPARIKCGAPDYIITTKDDIPIGYIEAKDIGIDLKKADKTEQLKRYKKGLSNLVLTDYLEFRFYLNGTEVAKVRIAEVDDFFKKDGPEIKPLPDNFAKFKDLLREFCIYSGVTIKSSLQLAQRMADKARIMANVIEGALDSDEKTSDNSTLREQMNAFKDILIHDITTNEFADIYAQTIAYGMFAARLHDPTLESFSRQEAAELIPKSNPFLRKLFQYIAGYDLDDRIRWIVDALADIFKATDVAALLANFGKATQQSDPIIHFYETFLAEYDPKLRKSRGVWYTPEPVVNFIVRAVDDILKTEFGLSKGLAETSKTTIELDSQIKDKRSKTGYKRIKQQVHKVQILDPATGTGTFLAEVVKHIHKDFEGQEGIWSNYVEEHLIPRLNGFEILMASYAMAHLKIDMILRETGFKAKKDDRLRIFLTNSMEEHHKDTGTLWASWLSNEASEANHIKRDTPVMVVIGNPPYSGHSSNKGEWIEKLLLDYKQEPGGGKLQERNPKWLNDDYVKFIRYGQHFVEKNGEGVLAYITNHGFLDNPTFRGMRWNLLNTFDKIYIVDLHGNSKKKEVCPDGSPDKNVFDIQQGVSINLFVKTGKKKAGKLADLYHTDLYGTREVKYDYLCKKGLKNVEFEKLELTAPQYFFVQKDFEVQKIYDKGFSVQKLFTVSSVGIVTSRDSFVINSSREVLKDKIETFFTEDKDYIIKTFDLKENTSWKIDAVKGRSNSFNINSVQTVSYRPFDLRYIYYDENFIERSRSKIMRHFLDGDNLGLVIGRQGQVVGSMPWNLSFVTNNITDFNLYYRGGGMLFPLYLYPETDGQPTLGGNTERRPNLDMGIVKEIADKLELTFTPEKEERADTFAPIDILDYIYAVLHSPAYREKYKEFLKIDFPRVPYPKDKDTFWRLVGLGGEIRQIHLLESPVVEKFITTYPNSGDNKVVTSVGKKDFEVDDKEKGYGRVRINENQYFDKVPVVAWEFYIGGYQPAQKWLKDRKGRELSFDDIQHYQKIIVALTETDRLMKEIDSIVEF